MVLAVFYNKVKHPQGISTHLLVSEMILGIWGHFSAFIIIFIFTILFYIGVQLLNNIVLIAGAQRTKLYLHMCLFFSR